MDVFTIGNSKVGPNVLCFNIPAIETCMPSEWCRKHCYAKTGWFQLPNVKESIQRRYALSRTPEFFPVVSKALKHSDKTYVRIHVSGDFYSQRYVHQWACIVSDNPNKKFMVTTKRSDLTISLQDLDSLPNINVMESVDYTRRYTAMVPSIMVLEGAEGSAGAYACPGSCQRCGYYCWNKGVVVEVKIIGDYYHRHVHTKL